MKVKLLCLFACLCSTHCIFAQEGKDSLSLRIARYTARNFSELRTFNLYWEVSPAYDYTLKKEGKNLEKGKMETIRIVNFHTTLPLIRRSGFSLYANGEFSMNHFKPVLTAAQTTASVFATDRNNRLYYRAGLTANYHNRVFGKPLLLSVSAGFDGWEKGIEKITFSFLASTTVVHSASNTLSVGLHGMYPYQTTPVTPLLIWSHRFTPDWTLDLTLPSRFYIRYQYKQHRFSAGTALENEQFYIRPGRKDLPETCYFNKTIVRAEMIYEWIIDKRFFFSVRAGGTCALQGGFYDTDRKGSGNDPYAEIGHDMMPFVRIGFSYNIFK